MTEEGDLFSCVTREASDHGIVIHLGRKLKADDKIVLDVPPLGSFEGKVVKPVKNGALVRPDISSLRQEKITKIISDIAKRQAVTNSYRRHVRIVPKNNQSVLSLQDKRQFPIEILNISVSGAAIRCPINLDVGQFVIAGKRPAKVIRTKIAGKSHMIIGVNFINQIPESELDEDYVL